MQRTLRFRLFLQMVLPVGLAFALILALLFQHEREEVHELGLSQAQRRAEQIALRASGLVTSIEARVEALSAALAGLPEAQRDAAPSIIEAALRQHTELVGAVWAFAPADGGRPANATSVQIDPQGRAEQRVQRDDPNGDWVWYQRALAEAAPHWRDPFASSRETGSYVLARVEPIRRGERVIGALAVGVRIADLPEVLQIPFPRTDYVVLDDQHRLIYHAQLDRIGKDLVSTLVDTDIDGFSRWIHDPAAGAEEVRWWADEASYFVAKARLESTGWLFAYRAPGSEFDQGLRQGAIGLLAVVLATLLVLALLARWLADRLGRPLETLAAASEALSAGQQELQLPARSDDEIGQLSNAFGRMATALQQREAELRHQAHDLGERMKERSAMYAASALLARRDLPLQALFDELVKVLQAAFLLPTHTRARLQWGELVAGQLEGCLADPRLQAEAATRTGVPVQIEIALADGTPEPCFLEEERMLVNQIAASMAQALEHRTDELALRELNEMLEQRIEERTAELRASELRFRQLLDAAPDPWVLLDADGRIQMINQAMRLLLDRLQGAVPTRIVPLLRSAANGPPLQAEDLFRLARDPQRNSVRGWMQGNRDGLPVEASASVVDDAGHALVAVALRDISLPLAGEQALADAKQLAESANQAKSEFLANMSHEIRTPMNAVIGMTHLALQGTLDERARNYIGKAHRAAHGLLGVINDILDFSKIEAGKLEVEAVEFRLEDTLDSLLDVLSLRAEQKGIELLFDLPAELPSGLIGDPLRLSQVLLNLGSNALKFTDRGEVVLGLRVVASHAHRVRLRFWVRDTGIGMSAEQLRRVFESFSQADTSTTRRFGGTGLGLAISRRLVQLMGGQLEASSRPGEGSTFWFEIDLAAAALPSDRIEHAALRDLRVLVVDDNLQAREILTSLLRSFGCRVDCTESGAMALQACLDSQGDPYQAVFMDWQMPDLDGLETTRNLQSQLGDAAPPVVMVTGYGRQEVAEAARDVQLSGLLTKPVTPSHLLDALASVTQSQPLQSADHRDASAGPPSLAGVRVLLVEDNEINQELACELLRDTGAEVLLASNGIEALQQLDRAPIDLVLMDCQMPLMDGFEATRRLRADPRFSRLPVIAMTAHARDEDRQRVLAAGMDDHLGKPIDFALFYATLQRWAPARDLESGPAPTSGRDRAGALSRLQGNEALLQRLQQRFLEGLPRLRAELTHSDAAVRARAAHTLRGLAGSLGAKALQRLVGELEQAQGGHPASAVLACETVLAELDRLHDTLAAEQRETTTTEASAGSAVNADQRILLDRLLLLCADYDATARDHFEAHAAALQGLPLAQLRAALSSFDFDGAAARIRELLDAPPAGGAP